MRTVFLFSLLAVAPTTRLDATALAREAPQDPGSAPPPPQKPKKPNTDNATQNAPDQPTWDPQRAEKDLEVGQYYMHKGDYDAAMDRFTDALTAKPGFAVPYRFLGEAQEKKGLKKKALKSYQKYVDMVPHADDADKIRKRIEKLQRDVDKENK